LSEAVACFEEGHVASISAEGRKFAAWWEQHKKRAHSMGVVFSEDHAPILEMYGMLFSRAGWKNISLTHDAEETLRIVQKVRPALVVTDMLKPGMMTGKQLARDLKANPATREIPVLLVSAVGLMGNDDDNCRSLFCGVVSKMESDLWEKLPRIVEMAIAGKYVG
jgi:CheY-like chemotaxis protein